AGYRTFPARFAALLSVVAGVFGVMGALGTGIRASAVATANDDPREVRALMGYRAGIGWLLAILAVLLVVASLAWLGRSKPLKLGAAGVSIAFAVLAAVRLSFFDRRAGDWADAALQEPNFVGYHAGLGWGAWLLLAAAVVGALAVLVGALRALDLRKGMGS
ncbi:MAG: hypothetical protein ACRDKS_00860, partial [Actinomycetota bacterium]